MDGFFIVDAVNSLDQEFPDVSIINELKNYCFKSSWCKEDREYVLNLVSISLTNKKISHSIAEYFSPILLDLFYRMLKNQPRFHLFCTLGRLIGSYKCATNFAYDCFTNNLFNNIVNEIQDENDSIDFLESSYLFLKFDVEFFVNNFDWSFVVDYLNLFSDGYRKYLSNIIYSTIFKTPIKCDNTSDNCNRIKIFNLCIHNQPKYLSKTIKYYDNCAISESKLIKKEDFSPELICVEGILLSVVNNKVLYNDNNKLDYDEKFLLTGSCRKNLKSIALGVSLNQPILLVGAMSCGKSSLIKQLAHFTGRYSPPEIVTIQISDQVDTKYLLGSYVCSEIPGEFLFNLGPLLKAIRDGHWIVLEDVDSASSELLSSIVSIIESRNASNIPGCEGKIEKFNTDFRIFFTRNVQTSESIVPNINFKMLEKICHIVKLESYSLDELSEILSQKWPKMKLLIPKIISIYEELTVFYYDTKIKRGIWLRDLMKWCNRLSQYFQINSNEAAKFAFLDAIDCFNNFLSNPELFLEVSFKIGAHFNLSKSECQHLIEERVPNVVKQPETLTIGRQSVPLTKLSCHTSGFAFTPNTTRLLEKLLVCLSNEESILLCGETGVGKTSCIQYLANLCGQKLNIINMNQQSTSMELFGGHKPVDFKYLMSLLHEAYLKLFDETFNQEKNKTFRNKFVLLHQNQDWKILLTIMIHVCEKGSGKCKDNQDLYQKWKNLKENLIKYQTLLESKNQLTFKFIEGILTSAIRNGEWILLDEINLAENETLQSLLSFMENDYNLMLFEKSHDQIVKVHQNFRLFSCMNPSTDIGKKELPNKIRSRFTEFFIQEITEPSQLRTIVCSYVESILDSRTIEAIVNFHLQIKKDSQTLLKDINGHRPIFSLRNLCRALRVTRSNPFNSIQRSLYEAISLAFLSNLDQDSYELVQKRIKEMIFSNKNLSKLFDLKLEKLFPENKFVIIENYPIYKGPNAIVVDETYILTSTVTKNLQDICRIISAGQTFPILLQGETSVGKTSMIRWLADATGNTCHRVNNHEHTDLQEYIGSYCSEPNGKIVFKKGILVEAMQHGYWIILDELNLAPTEVLEALNRVLDENREIFIPETQEIIKAHPRFLLFATQNPPGRYGGRKILSRAFRNRFIELNFSEIPLTELEIILHKKCTIPLSYAKRMVSVLTQLRKRRCESDIFAGKHGFITLRDLFRWGYRYRKFSSKLDESIKFFDWNQFLANQGYILLAGRVRDQQNTLLIKDILEKTFKCTISLEELFYGKKSFESYSSEKFKNIVWTKAFKRLGTLLHEAIEHEEPILLVGETGCGKTTICQYFADLNKKDLKIINCHMNTESGDFLGSLRPNRNIVHDQNEALFEWVDGPLITAMKNGDYFLVDEISLADDSVLERLNSVLEMERRIFVAEKSDNFSIEAKPSFRYFATMNPGGDFGKKELSPALRDRFTEIWCPTFEDFEDIKLIIYHNLHIDDKDLRSHLTEMIYDFTKWFHEFTNKSKRFTISIRDLISWVNFINEIYVNKKCLNIQEAFSHGADLIFIDPLTNSNAMSYIHRATNILELKKTCKDYIEKLSKRLPFDESSFQFLIDPAKFFHVGPFHIKKGLHVPDFKSSYCWQSDGVKSNALRVLRALQLDKPILLEGPPGVGKTTLVQALADASGHSLIRINLSDQTDISDLFGCDLPMEGEGSAGKFCFREGPFLTALKSESTWILLDELNLASQTVLEGLNACFDHRGEIYISELNKTFHVDRSKTRIFASQNPLSMDGTRKGLPKSFLNRFVTVYIDELDEQDFRQILTESFSNIPPEYIEQMVKVNQKICEKMRQDNSFARKGGPFEFNLRDLIRWTQLVSIRYDKSFPISPGKFFDLIYTNKMRTPEDKEAMKQICYNEFSYSKDEIMYYISQSFIQFGYSLFEKDKNLIINNKFANYVFEKDKNVIESILISIKMDWLVILVGESGFGKTHLIQLVSDLCGKELVILNVNSEMDTIDLLGGFEQKNLNYDLKCLEEQIIYWSFQFSSRQQNCNLKSIKKFLNLFFKLKNTKRDSQTEFKLQVRIDILKQILNLFEKNEIILSFKRNLSKFETINSNLNNGTFEWRDSSLIKSIQTGGWVLIDNANLLNPAVLDRLNSLLEPGGSLTINEKGSIDGELMKIYPHKNFRLFLTMNPRFGELSRAMRNRGIEIVLPATIDCDELKNITLNHGFEFTSNEIEIFLDYNSFFKFLNELILKNQHGSANNQFKYLGNISEIRKLELSIKNKPTNLNCLTNDPQLYYALRDYFSLNLPNSNDMIQIRLYLENSILNDYEIRFKILEYFNSENLDNNLIQILDGTLSLFKKRLKQELSNDVVDFIQMLPIDFRENPDLLQHFRIQGKCETINFWNQRLNELHLNLFWIDLKYRLKKCSPNSILSLKNEHRKHIPDYLESIHKFSLLMLNCNSLFEDFLPDDKESISIHNILVILFELLAIVVRTELTEWDNCKIEFLSLWNLLIESENFLNFSKNKSLTFMIPEMNNHFKMDSLHKSKWYSIQSITKNYFRFKSSEDIEIYSVYKEFINLLKNIRNNDNNDYIETLNNKSVNLLTNYFCRLSDFKTIYKELSDNNQLLKDMINQPIMVHLTSNNILFQLISSMKIIDKFINGSSVFSDIPSNFLSKFFTCLFQNNKNNHNNDLLLDVLLNFNEEFNLASVIQCFEPSSDNPFSNILNEKLIQNITFELMPIFSLIYFNIVNDRNDSIIVAFEKQQTRNLYFKFLSSNYFLLKNNSCIISDRFISLSKMFQKQIQDTVTSFETNSQTLGNTKFNDCFDMILFGYSLANYTKPDYPIDPVVLTKSKLNDSIIQSDLIDEELNLRHNLYSLMYNYHDGKFNSNFFRELRKKSISHKDDALQLQQLVVFRRSPNDYFNLAKEINQFHSTIFHWDYLKKILKELNDCLKNPEHEKSLKYQIVARCMSYFQSINDFLKRLHENFFDYQDLTSSYMLGLYFVLKGLQFLVYHLQSSINTEELFGKFDSKVMRKLFQMFSQVVDIQSPSETNHFIFKDNILQNLIEIFQNLKLDSKELLNDLLESTFLEVENSLTLGEEKTEVLPLYIKTIDLFVKQWEKIETEQELNEIKKNALFHIKLEEEEDPNDTAEKRFPSFQQHFKDFIDVTYEFETTTQQSNSIEIDISKDLLLLIAKSHLNMVDLIENPQNDISYRKFIKPYTNRYQIISQIFKKTFGFFEFNVEQELIDGHLLVNDYRNWKKSIDEEEKRDIYLSSFDSETQKCFAILESLRLKIINELLPQFENHPTLAKLLQIIKRIYEIKADSSFLCLATGLELILKTSEDWQLIAHKGISLVEHLNEITGLLISWRKIEINYWLQCLDTVGQKIDEKELSIWWLRFYMAINDLIKEQDFDKTIEFINNIKNFMENSTLGQFSIRLKIINVFYYYLKFSIIENFDILLIALENLYNFYHHFHSSILQTIESEKNTIQKEIQQFVSITKWNPNNFWSLKASLTKSKEQLYGYVKKYDQCLNKPASSLYQFEKKIFNDKWKMENASIKSNPTIFIGDVCENHFPFLEKYQFVAESKSYMSKTIRIIKKIKNSPLEIRKINELEDINVLLIDGINQYSNLQVKENKDLDARKKIVAQIQNQKRRALSDMFKKLVELGLNFRKGLVHLENLDFDKTIFSIKSLDIVDGFEEFSIKTIESCNNYFYKYLSGFSRFVLSSEKPNSQLTPDMIDRIKGFVVDLTRIVIEQQQTVNMNLVKFNEFYNLYHKIEMNLCMKDRSFVNHDIARENIEKFRKLILQALSFVIRLKANVISLKSGQETFKTIDIGQFDLIIDAIKKLNDDFQLKDCPFYTESSFKKFKLTIETFHRLIEDLSLLLNQVPKFLELNIRNLNFIRNQTNNIQNNIDQQLEQCSHQSLVVQVSSHLDPFLKKLNLLIKSILVSIEKVFKNVQCQSENQKTSDLINNQQSIQTLSFFNVEKLGILMNELINHVEENSKDPRSKCSMFFVQMMNRLMPFFSYYLDLFHFNLSLSFGSLRTSSKLLHVLITLSNDLLANGFCLPPDISEDQRQGEQQKNLENTGFGEGSTSSDAKDVSDRLDCQDQLDDLDLGDGQEDEDDQNNDLQNNKNDDKGIEMDQDFDGKEYDPQNQDESNHQDGDENEQDEDEDNDLDEKMGEVDDDEQILDERIWGDDDQSEEEQTDGSNQKNDDLTGGQEDVDSRTVANQDNNNLKSENNAADNKDENNENPLDEKDDEEQLSPDSPVNADTDEINKDYNENLPNNDINEKEIMNEMVLPENLELDGDIEDDQNEDMKMDFEEDDNHESDNNDDEETMDDGNELNDKSEKVDDINDNKEPEVPTDNPLNVLKNSDITQPDNAYGNPDNPGQSNDDCQNQDNDPTSSNKQGAQLDSSNNTNQIFNFQTNSEIIENMKEYSITKNRDRCIAEDPDQTKAKRQKITHRNETEFNEKTIESKSNSFRHVEDRSKSNDFAYDIATKHDQEAMKPDDSLDRQIDSNENEKQIEQINEEIKESNVTTTKNSDIVDKLQENTNDENMDKQIPGDIILTTNVNYDQSSYHTNMEQPLHFGVSKENDTSVPTMDLDMETIPNLDYKQLVECEKRVESLVYELCNHLQLVLEPTKRSKYKGDFKNGKRLNMRKVIAYVASQFRKDKIWLRRTKPSKRQYQIIIAVDDSLSMSDNQSRLIAFESLILLGKSLSIIESGLLSVISFGEQVKILHPFGSPFTDQTAYKMFSKFQFNQKCTKINELLKCSWTMFSDAKQHSSSGESSLHQLLLIVSDGRGIFSEGQENIQLSIMKLKEKGIFSVFIIIDNPEHKNSIIDIRIPVFNSSGGMKIESYIDQFPFPFYVILKDINSLPSILGEALRQWFELITIS